MAMKFLKQQAYAASNEAKQFKNAAIIYLKYISELEIGPISPKLSHKSSTW